MRLFLNCYVATLLLLPAFAGAQETVSVMPLSEVLVDLERRAPADVAPLNDARLVAEVSAVVQSVLADVGQTVMAGDLLIELDDTDYQLGLARAEANLASARAQKAEAEAKLSRARQLTENNYISADELLERETSLTVTVAGIRAAEVELKTAQRNLAKCQIKAPFAGVVTEREGQVGSFVNIGSGLLKLTQTDRIELNAELPSALADSLSGAATLRFESRGEQWPLDLLRLSPVIDRERRVRLARFVFKGETPEVGRSGEVVWQVERGLMPSNLVSQRDGRLGVFLYVDGRAEFTPIINAQEGRPVAVDLPAESLIIVTGRDKLQDGDPVTTRP